MNEQVHVVSKFGVHQMNPFNKENTKGFFYGNVTLSDGSSISISEKSKFSLFSFIHSIAFSDRVSMFIVPESMIKTIVVDSIYPVSCGTMLSVSVICIDN